MPATRSRGNDSLVNPDGENLINKISDIVNKKTELLLKEIKSLKQEVKDLKDSNIELVRLLTNNPINGKYINNQLTNIKNIDSNNLSTAFNNSIELDLSEETIQQEIKDPQKQFVNSQTMHRRVQNFNKHNYSHNNNKIAHNKYNTTRRHFDNNNYRKINNKK